MFRSQVRKFSSTARAELAKINLIGVIGTDISEAVTSNGRPYVRYALAVDNKAKGNENTSWFNIVAFTDHQINFTKTFLGKGAKVYVEADVSNNVFEKDDGSKAVSWNLYQRTIEVIRFPKASSKLETSGEEEE
ncbi:hypothetical protein OGAPHI_002939 [Ogataea philodendri]|uniref:Single-stranded DNA-binding protein n=1 Tax=Ogataea philodendri TaxID=1378263 RepID=A0A9P8P8S0_9ASCO|nr:uncharacterized protein OGAPHI_002939 [Ogataea philodendri]KAH3667290.1 hypothetical protein OGAPHI_002939 [Ogataea philodendri]